jgi:hypothetical protein
MLVRNPISEAKRARQRADQKRYRTRRAFGQSNRKLIVEE